MQLCAVTGLLNFLLYLPACLFTRSLIPSFRLRRLHKSIIWSDTCWRLQRLKLRKMWLGDWQRGHKSGSRFCLDSGPVLLLFLVSTWTPSSFASFRIDERQPRCRDKFERRREGEEVSGRRLIKRPCFDKMQGWFDAMSELVRRKRWYSIRRF